MLVKKEKHLCIMNIPKVNLTQTQCKVYGSPDPYSTHTRRAKDPTVTKLGADREGQ